MSSNLVELPKPIEEVRPPLVYTKVLISVVGIELGVSASIQALLMSESGAENKNVLLEMSGDAYAGWGGDDSYVVNWVLSQIQ